MTIMWCPELPQPRNAVRGEGSVQLFWATSSLLAPQEPGTHSLYLDATPAHLQADPTPLPSLCLPLTPTCPSLPLLPLPKGPLLQAGPPKQRIMGLPCGRPPPPQMGSEQSGRARLWGPGHTGHRPQGHTLPEQHCQAELPVMVEMLCICVAPQGLQQPHWLLGT